ncbi:hypothetical protein [Staphylococcus phage vB_StaM_SA1]|nr:hypothetical protein [Staphylococcus phage vB_StaM_SA1]
MIKLFIMLAILVLIILVIAAFFLAGDIGRYASSKSYDRELKERRKELEFEIKIINKELESTPEDEVLQEMLSDKKKILEKIKEERK